MAVENAAGTELTIDELARRAQLPVRTIREYHTMRLLPSPERRGRVGYYGPVHVERLELIARLQRRGYSLAGIRDLLQSWAAGTDLTSLLGVEPARAPLDELPLRLTGAELLARVPALSGAWLAAANDAGLILRAGDNYVVRSPALLALVADATAAGIPVSDVLDLVGTLHRQLSSVAGALADVIAFRLLPTVSPGGDASELVPFIQRGRMLLLQGAASTLADRLAAALISRSASQGGGNALRTALEQISVGAIADSSGAPTAARR